MAATSKLGPLLKEARTKAGLTQEQLARKVPGVSAADISEAERGKSALTQDALKQIAKVTGVTQKSLLDAAKADKAPAAKPAASAKTSSAKTSSAKTSSAKTSSAKTSSAKTSSAKTSSAKTSSAKPAAKTPANANSTMKVTDTERKLVDAYRAATSAQKKAALKVLRGEADDQLDAVNGTGGAANLAGDLIQNALSGLAESIFGGNK